MSVDTNQLRNNWRKAEQKWRKSKLQVHYDLLSEQLGIYNKTIRNGRQANFSSWVTNNPE